MNWLAVAIAAYLLTGFDLGLRDGLQPSRMVPSLILPFIVFVGLFAPPVAGLWTGLLVGLAIDLSTQRGSEAAVIVGPHAIGCLVAAYFVLSVRGVVMRRNPLTLATLSILAAAAAGLVSIAILTWRRLYGDPVGFTLADELLGCLGSSLATGLSALVLSAVLFPMIPVFRFHDPASRRFARREA